MTNKTEGLEVVAWMRRDGMKAMPADEKVGWEQSPRHSDVAEDYTVPLVYLTSAQVAVAAKQYNVDTWYERFVESEKRITALESALGVAREALQASANVPCYGGHPKQEAAIALIDNVLGGNT